MSDTNASNSGIGVTGLLLVLFIGLKLGHVIDWSWLWVLSPIWIPAGLVAALLLIGGAVIGIRKAVKAR